jgi:hypothetical protein
MLTPDDSSNYRLPRLEYSRDGRPPGPAHSFRIPMVSTVSLQSVNSCRQIAHVRPCSTILRSNSFRGIPAGERSSRYPLG